MHRMLQYSLFHVFIIQCEHLVSNYQVRGANTLIVFLRVSLVVRHNPEGITVISWSFNTSVVVSL